MAAGLRLVVAGTVLTLASGCRGAAGDPRIAEGRALYEANCTTCHGENALGDGPMASALPIRPPGLQEHLGHHTEAQLIRLIRGGVPPAMPPSAVSEEEVRLIVDYLWTLVPESEVAALREMQRHMETMADSATGTMPGMTGMPTMEGTNGAQGVAVPSSAAHLH